MFTLQDIKQIELDRLVNYINQKNIKIKPAKESQDYQNLSQDQQYPTQINMKSLILSLKNNTIDYLKNQFMLNNDQVTVQKFLYLMKECITYQKYNEYQILYELIKLFQEIDIDASNSMDWSEFLQYLAGYGWVGDTKERKDKNQKEKFITWANKEQNQYRKHSLKKIVQVQKLGMLCILESVSNTLTFIDMSGIHFTRLSQVQQHHEGIRQKCKPQAFTLFSVNLKKVLSIDYCQQQRLFGILITDKSLIFIQDGQIQKVVINIQGNGHQSQIMYFPVHKLWLIKSINGLIQIVQSPKQAKLKERISFTPHQQPLTSIKQLRNPLCLCTSSLDGTIKLWSINYKQLLITLSPMNQQQIAQKTKGIKGIDTLNINSQSYIASWMFTTEIAIWLPSSSVSKPYIGKLKGHIGVIQNCQFFKHKEYLISIDNKMSIRLWNVQMMTCLQMLAAEDQSLFIKCLNSQPLALFYSKIIDLYRIKANCKFENVPILKANNIQIPKKLISISFCPYYIFILLLFNTQLRVIDVQSGKLVTLIYPTNRQEQQFNSIGLKINRRVFIGSTHGNIYYHHLDNGKLIKKFKIQNFQGFQKYSGFQIKFIYFHGDSKILLVIAQENNLSILLTFRQLLSYEFELTKVLQFQQVNLKKMVYIKKMQTLAICCDKIISLWDFIKMNITNSIAAFNKSIKDFLVLQTFNLILMLTEQNILIYQLEKQGFIKKIQIIQIPNKIKQNITKFNLQITNNEGLELSTRQKKVKRTVNKQKSVKFIIQQNQHDQKLMQEGTKSKLKSNQHILLNKHSKIKQNYILYLCSNQGAIYAFFVSDILIRKQIKQNYDTKISKFAGHTIREFRRCNVKILKNSPNPKYILDFQDSLLFQKQIQNSKIAQIGSIYRDVFYVLSQKGDIYILRTTGQINAIWHFDKNNFSSWNLHYNILPTVLNRLNRLEWILSINSKNQSVQGGQLYKVKFLANLYLDNNDILELKQYVKMSTVKLINASRQNLLFKKSLIDQTKQIKSLKKIDRQEDQSNKGQAQWNSIKKKSRVMSQKMKIIQKKKNLQEKMQNYFNQKYEDKKKQEQKLKIHRKYIQKRIQKTLSFAKSVQKLNRQKPQIQIQINKKQIQRGVNFLSKLEKALNQIQECETFQKHTIYGPSTQNNNLNWKNNKLSQKSKQSSLHKLTDNFMGQLVNKKQWTDKFMVIQRGQIKRAQSSHIINQQIQKKQVSATKFKTFDKISEIGIKSFIKKQYLPQSTKQKMFSSTHKNSQKIKYKLHL